MILAYLYDFEASKCATNITFFHFKTINNKNNNSLVKTVKIYHGFIKIKITYIVNDEKCKSKCEKRKKNLNVE